MTQYLFGSGTVIGKRTDVANTPPALFGTLQDVSLDFSRKIESLFGQYQSPVAFGGGELEIKGKAKSARFQATQLNNLFLGQTHTSSSGLDLVVGEAANTATTTFTVTNGATFVEDQGVYYASSGIQLTPVASGPATGQYVPGGAGVGTYTVAAGDENVNLLVYYSYTVATQQQITMSNQLMGPVPTFELHLKESFTYFGVAKSLVIKLNACVSDKMSLAFSNTKFSVPEMDIMAGADAAGNVGTISMTE